MKNHLIKKKKNFTIISNLIAKDTSISLKAKGMSLIIAHFPNNWSFYENTMQDFTKDGKTAISNALKELEAANYLYRIQSRNKFGKFDKKEWLFNDEKIKDVEKEEFLSVIKKPVSGISVVRNTGNTNTHSNKTIEENKKTTKKGSKKKYYDFVNRLRENALYYPDMQIEFEGSIYVFCNVNGVLLLKNYMKDNILSKIDAEKIYQKMSISHKLKIDRGVKR